MIHAVFLLTCTVGMNLLIKSLRVMSMSNVKSSNPQCGARVLDHCLHIKQV